MHIIIFKITLRSRLEEDADEVERKIEYKDPSFDDLLYSIEALKKESSSVFDCFLNYL